MARQDLPDKPARRELATGRYWFMVGDVAPEFYPVLSLLWGLVEVLSDPGLEQALGKLSERPGLGLSLSHPRRGYACLAALVPP